MGVDDALTALYMLSICNRLRSPKDSLAYGTWSIAVIEIDKPQNFREIRLFI